MPIPSQRCGASPRWYGRTGWCRSHQRKRSRISSRWRGRRCRPVDPRTPKKRSGRPPSELGKIDPVDGRDDIKQQVDELWLTASEQVAAATQDSTSTGSSATSSADLSTLLGSTPPSTLIPAPLVPATSSDPSLADLAGGTVAARAPRLRLRCCCLRWVTRRRSAPSFRRTRRPSSVAPAPPSSNPAPADPVPATDAPPSSDVPPSDETTSVPPAGGVDGPGSRHRHRRNRAHPSSRRRPRRR